MIFKKDTSKNKNKKRHRVFRSYTDTNNYNNFLLELDKRGQKQTQEYENIKMDIEEQDTNENTAIDKLIQTIEKQFNEAKLNNSQFTGISSLDSTLFYNPWTNNANVNNPDDCNKIDDNKNPEITVEKINIPTNINSIDDLLTIIEKYPKNKRIKYNIDIDMLHNIKEPLIDLRDMIGMKQLKENILDQILFYMQELHINESKTVSESESKNTDFMHTVIYGPPGTGKTEVAKIIGSIFAKMGILTKGTFKKVTRADLIAGFLGQTAIKTRDVIKDALGGVLFIDEAYALGNEEQRDSFSKECIDTLCEGISDHKDNLMVIIAGYEQELNNCFFNYNPGLNSRFTWRFKTDEYTSEDLYNIFVKKVTNAGWAVSKTSSSSSSIDAKWFKKNMAKFKYFGRDMELLFAKTKIAHSRRVFGLDVSKKKQITCEDLEKGFELYLKHEDPSKTKQDRLKNTISSMYI
jgi:SpoVK/Ycf46/Vps4 family AAA+-type ATPase